MSQSALQSIELPTNTNETNLDTNPSTINSYKPVLVKTNKEIAGIEERKINSKRVNTSGNSPATNDNKDAVEDFIRSIDIVASTVASLEPVYSKVKKSFVYKPNLQLLVNATIETNKFNAEKVANNICTVFAEKEPTNTRTSPIHLSESNLEKCRTVQKEVEDILKMEIDLLPVVNSMLYKGNFNPKPIVKAVRRLFKEIMEATLTQKSNKIN